MNSNKEWFTINQLCKTWKTPTRKKNEIIST